MLTIPLQLLKTTILLASLLFTGAVLAAEPATTGAAMSQADAFLLLGLIPFIPAALLMMTGFTRILIVFSLIRHALGLTTTPSNQILIGLSLLLTLCAMQPTIDKIESEAWAPWRKGETSLLDASQKATGPLREFMVRQIRPEAYAVLYPHTKPPQLNDAPLTTIAGAFALSELRTGFEIGILVFIPFLIIDILVASILMSLGMMMLSPTMISLPLKLLVFVLVDGWVLVAGGLLGSFQ